MTPPPSVRFDTLDSIGFFMDRLCHDGSGCWHDRHEACPILASLFTTATHPSVVLVDGKPMCAEYQSMTDGQKAARQEAKRASTKRLLKDHSGGLFPGLPPP